MYRFSKACGRQPEGECMSAYIVKDIIINRIVTHMIFSDDQWVIRDVMPSLYEEGVHEAFARKLFDLNVEAVKAAYGEGACKKWRYRSLDFKFEIVPRPDDLQVHEDLDEYLYQCHEGNIPRENLYKLMRNYHCLLCKRIIQERLQKIMKP